MQKIGEELKQERQRQKLSLEQVSEMTAFSISQLVALENGNLDFFKEDISYVKFFVQNYCKVLKIDYTRYRETFDDSMLTYTNLLSQKELADIRRSNDEIRKKAGVSKSITKKPREINLSSLSMLLMSTFMIAGVIYILSQYVMPNVLNGPSVTTTKPSAIVDPATTTSSAASSETTMSSIPRPLTDVTVNQTGIHEFEVSGYKTGDIMQIEIEFYYRTWIDVKLNGVSFKEPPSKIYPKNTKIVYQFEAKDGHEITMNVGYFDTNIFRVNGKIWPMDAQLAKSRTGQVIKLKLKGV